MENCGRSTNALRRLVERSEIRRVGLDVAVVAVSTAAEVAQPGNTRRTPNASAVFLRHVTGRRILAWPASSTNAQLGRHLSDC
jgi:hypothetical protein